jgi:hypothetical protein
MPLYLEPPAHQPGGPDGKGWNRLSLNAHIGTPLPRCALRPRSYPTLHESHRNTAHSRWGGDYAHCTRAGRCGTCPIFKAAPRRLRAFTDRVLVRIKEIGEPSDYIPGGVRSELWLMNKPEDGWASHGYRQTWEEIRRLNGWVIGRRHHDADGDGFWIEKYDPTTIDGHPAPSPTSKGDR